jgi:hypothetical protein
MNNIKEQGTKNSITLFSLLLNAGPKNEYMLYIKTGKLIRKAKNIPISIDKSAN